MFGKSGRGWSFSVERGNWEINNGLYTATIEPLYGLDINFFICEKQRIVVAGREGDEDIYLSLYIDIHSFLRLQSPQKAGFPYS